MNKTKDTSHSDWLEYSTSSTPESSKLHPTPISIRAHHITSTSSTFIRRNLLFQTRSTSLSLCLSLLLLNFLVISPSSQEEFNIDKLLEYNSLATCIGQIHKDFEQCNTRGAEKAKSFKVDLGDEWNKRLQCCGMWKLRDCWMRAAKAKCSKAQAEQVFKLPHLFLPDLATSCAEYTPESGKCTIPMWLIASVVSAVVVIAFTCLCGTFFCVKRLRARSRRRRALHQRHKRSSSNGATQLMPTLTTPNGKASHMNGTNGKAPPPTKNGCTASQPYLNGAAKVTINIEDGSTEECKSLNTPAAKQIAV